MTRFIDARLERARQRAREKHESAEAQAKRNHQEINKLSANLTELISVHLEYARLNSERSPDENNEKRDRKANERSIRRSTAWIAAFTVVLGIVGIVGAIISGFTLSAIQGQLGEMREEQRPWVSISSTNDFVVSTPLTFDESGGHITLQVGTVNRGHLPARFVWVDGDIFTTPGTAEDLKSHWKYCDDVRVRNTFSPMRPGKIVFPDQEHPQFAHFNISKTDVEYLKRMRTDKTLGTIYIEGCVDYVITSDEVRHHQTRFVLEIDRRGPKDTFAPIDPKDGDVPAQEIKIGINPLIGDDAD